MGMVTSAIDEITIKTQIGQILFTIWIDQTFFDHSPQQTSEKHNHAAFEFHFITHGVGMIYAGDENYEAATGSYYIVKEGIYHMQKKISSDNIKRYSFKFRFDIVNDLSGISPEDEIKGFVYALSNIKFFLSDNLDSIMHIISDIQTELECKTIGFYTKVQYLFSLLFITIIREIAHENKKDESAVNELNQKDRMRIIERFFESNVNQKVTLKDLCALVDLSKSQLNRILREKYDMSFKQKHIEVQIEHIKDKLINTNMSVNRISDQMGYTSVSNFTTFFKHKTGLTPKAYRKSLNHNQ